MTDPPYPDQASRVVLESGCARCPPLVEARECIAWGNGSRDAELFVVGEAPSAGDPDADRWCGGNLTGLAYTARHSGRRIRALFDALGYGPDDLYFTNAVKCFPAAPADPSTNREPSADERAACRGHLVAELERVDPAAIVPTGRHATESVFTLGGLTLEGFLDVVLEPQTPPELAAPVLPLLHPAYEAVWRTRLGYPTREAYRGAVGTALSALQ